MILSSFINLTSAADVVHLLMTTASEKSSDSHSSRVQWQQLKRQRHLAFNLFSATAEVENLSFWPRRTLIIDKERWRKKTR